MLSYLERAVKGNVSIRQINDTDRRLHLCKIGGGAFGFFEVQSQ